MTANGKPPANHDPCCEVVSEADTGLVDNAKKRRGNITLSAPVGSIDLAAEDENGEPYEIRACNYCLPWYAEVRRDDDGNVFVREWHAVDCEHFQELLAAAKD
jgi:proline racemase